MDAEKPQFTHRKNSDGTYDSICMKCFLTVAREKRSDTVLTEPELQHDCTGLAEANLENAPFILGKEV